MCDLTDSDRVALRELVDEELGGIEYCIDAATTDPDYREPEDLLSFVGGMQYQKARLLVIKEKL